MTSGGAAKCWGNNGDGELGDGTTTNRTTPTDVIGLASGVTASTAGFRHTCALTSAGDVKCWGDNDSGQLGDGTNEARTTPMDVGGLPTGVVAVDAGGEHTCVVTNAGGVKCWGDGSYGQLGVNPGWTPVDVVGFGAPPAAVLYLPVVFR